jgi:hypothetical protein
VRNLEFALILSFITYVPSEVKSPTKPHEGSLPRKLNMPPPNLVSSEFSLPVCRFRISMAPYARWSTGFIPAAFRLYEATLKPMMLYGKL